MEFDYGDKKENGQYERYPTLPDTEKVKVPVLRRTYIHRICGVATKISESIAQTYVVNPKYYSHTFCVGCREHLPVGQFEWEDGVTVGDTKEPYYPPRLTMKYISEQESYFYDNQDQMNTHIQIMTQNGWTLGAKDELKIMFLRTKREAIER